MAARLVSYLRKRDLEGRSVLEVGGGVGDFQMELLKSGAATAVNVELSPEYEETARELIEAEGMAGRIDRRLGDFVDQQAALQPADVVVLNRVICCYPWMEPMLGASVDKTRWLLAIAVPRDRLVSRMMVKVGNTVQRLAGHDFESYVHSVDRMQAVASRNGMTPVFEAKGLIWQGLVFERV